MSDETKKSFRSSVLGILTALATLVTAVSCSYVVIELPATEQAKAQASQTNDSDQLLRNAFENQRSNFQVEGKGKVIKILPDDLSGSKHQRFIVRLSSGQTLLIAHNIDLAPRINSLSVGDLVVFYGEYVWNPQGGLIQWTHNDPRGDSKCAKVAARRLAPARLNNNSRMI